MLVLLTVLMSLVPGPKYGCNERRNRYDNKFHDVLVEFHHVELIDERNYINEFENDVTGRLGSHE